MIVKPDLAKQPELGSASVHQAVRPKISVIIPVFNKAEAIEHTIQSVLNQTRLPDEIVVVDDGSTDASAERVKKSLAAAHRAIRSALVRQKNAGVSAARNRAFEHTRSDYIALLDGDDEWSPSYLEEIEKLALRFPQAGVLSVRRAVLDAEGHLSPQASVLPDDFFGTLDRPLNAYRKGYGIFGCSSVVLRRDAWERAGGFPEGERSGEDIYLWLKLCLSETIAHSSAPLSIWRHEHSGAALRKGAVPYHLRYFLGTREGRQHLWSGDLIDFLGSNLAVHLVARRVHDELDAAAELRRLVAQVPLLWRVKCWIGAYAPRPCLRALAHVRRTLR